MEEKSELGNQRVTELTRWSDTILRKKFLEGKRYSLKGKLVFTKKMKN